MGYLGELIVLLYNSGKMVVQLQLLSRQIFHLGGSEMTSKGPEKTDEQQWNISYGELEDIVVF